MKKILLTSAIALASVAAFAQGTVNFVNASTVAGWTSPSADRYAHWDTTALSLYPNLTVGGTVASNSAGYNLSSLRAALYYASSTDNNLADFVAASGGSASFKGSTSATVGSWFGHTDTLDTIPLGTTANLVVFVWDTSVNADPRAAGNAGGLYGHSAIFQYTPPTNPTPLPSDFLPQNMGPVNVGLVPEPTTFALAGLGAAALLIFRRRK